MMDTAKTEAIPPSIAGKGKTAKPKSRHEHLSHLDRSSAPVHPPHYRNSTLFAGAFDLLARLDQPGLRVVREAHVRIVFRCGRRRQQD